MPSTSAAIALLCLLCLVALTSRPSAAQPPAFPSPPFSTSAASSSPLSLTPEQQTALAHSAQSAGYSLSQATSTLQTARDQGIALTPPTPEPSSCASGDNECAFYKACFPCYAQRSLAMCLPCLALKECQGMRPCEMDRACKVCSTLPADNYRPHACEQLRC